MDTANRIIVILMLVLVGVVCSIALVKPGLTFSFIEQEAEAMLRFIQQWPEGEPLWYVRVGVGVVVAIALDLLLIFAIYIQVRRPSARDIRVTKAEGGEVTLGVSSIVDRLQYEIDHIEGVLRSRPKVSGGRKGVSIEVVVETVTGVDVPRKAGEIVQRVRSVVEENMGLMMVRDPKVTLRSVADPGRIKKAKKKEEEPPPPPPWMEEMEPESDISSMDETQASSPMDEDE